jgi:hypothetical protein
MILFHAVFVCLFAVLVHIQKFKKTTRVSDIGGGRRRREDGNRIRFVNRQQRCSLVRHGEEKRVLMTDSE